MVSGVESGEMASSVPEERWLNREGAAGSRRSRTRSRRVQGWQVV